MNQRPARPVILSLLLTAWIFLFSAKAMAADQFTPSTLAALPEVENIAATNEIFIVISFNTNLDPVSASNPENYQLNGNLSIVDAFTLGSFVQLQVLPMNPGQAYQLTLNDITDLEGDAILPNTKIDFRYGAITTESFQNENLPNDMYFGGQDTYLASGAQTTNFGLENGVLADGRDGSNLELVSLLKWELNEIPANAIILDASVELDIYNPSGGAYELYATNGPWEETSVTWDSYQPEVQRGALLATFRPNRVGRYNIDLNANALSMIQNWVTLEENYGIQIVSQDDTAAISNELLLFSANDLLSPQLLHHDKRKSKKSEKRKKKGKGKKDKKKKKKKKGGGNRGDDNSGGDTNDGGGDNGNDGGPAPEPSGKNNDGVDFYSNQFSDFTSRPRLNLTFAQAPGANLPPIASFFTTEEELTTIFVDNSLDRDGMILEWYWDFGDNNSSTIQDPIHTYAAPGVYAVTLTVVDNRGEEAVIVKRVLVKRSTPPEPIEKTVILQDGRDGYFGTADSYLSNARPHHNYGHKTVLLADGEDPHGCVLVSYLKWDLSSIPKNAIIKNVAFRFKVFNASAGKYKIYEVTQAWDEDEVTWRSANPMHNRGEKLGYFYPKREGETVVELNEAGINKVQAWVSGHVNHGFAIIPYQNKDGVDFYSREYEYPHARPALEITYEVIPNL